MTQKTSRTITHTHLGHTLTSTLFGDITESRLAAAKIALIHRAEQLYSVNRPSAYHNRSEQYSRKSFSSDTEYPNKWNDEELEQEEYE